MADSYIVPPVDDSPEALDIFFHQICEQINPASELTEATAPTTDYPTDVTGITATGGYGNTRIVFDPVGYSGHNYTLIIRAIDGNINNAIAVGSTSTDVYIDDITEPQAGTTYTYWAKHVNIYGTESTNWSSPATTQLQVDVAYAVDVLAGKLGYDEFGEGSFPVRTEDVLPTLPDANYPINSVILLTTNGKLYRNVSGSWTAEIPLVDVTGAGNLAGFDDITLALVTDSGDLASQNRTNLLYTDGADVTLNNTSNDTTYVNGTLSTTITSDLAQALSDAATAQSTADGKIVSYYQTTMPAGSEGDLWIDTDDGNRLYRHNGTTFVEIQDDGISTAISDAAGAQATADGKVTTFYSTTTPTAEGEGDLWFNSTTGLVKRWSGTVWVEYASYNTGDLADLDNITLSLVTDAGLLAGLNDITLAKVTDSGTLAALNTVGSTQITDGAVITAKIFAGAVVADKLAVNSVIAGKIATNAIVADNITAGAIVAGKIAVNAVTANTIEANAIVAGKIAAAALVVDDGVMQNGYIKNALIDDATITSAKISSLNADQINVGTLTGFTIQTNATPTTSGGVIQSGNHIRVYDTTGTLRVEIGELS